MEESRDDGVLTVRITQADLAEPTDLYLAFSDMIFERGELRIRANLSGVSSLDSLQIGTLVSIHLLAYENVVVLSFEGVSERMRALFKLIGVDNLIEAHYPSRGEWARPAAPNGPREPPGGHPA